jgi:hypothetical protein
MTDCSRNFLLTGFVCASCGEILTLSYDISKESKSKYFDGQPTGADTVQKVIAIHPCDTCLEPVRKIKDAMKTLQEI